jgi:hypothetical protein
MMVSLAAQRTALFGAVLMFAVPSAHAQSGHIGNTPVARNDVQGTLGTGVVTVHVGDDVFRDEGMHTGGNSEARIVFLDDTNVSLGPNSNLKLDKFVYSDQGAQAVTINVTKGVFRFVTGKGDHNAYKINTPFATIGVRAEADIKAHRDAVVAILGVGGQTRMHSQRVSTSLLSMKQFTWLVTRGSRRGFSRSAYKQAHIDALDLRRLASSRTYH